MTRTFVLVLALALAGCSGKQPLPSFGVVPDFTLTSQTGQPFESRRALDGKVWVANFIFTTCTGPCPRMSAQLRRVRQMVPNREDLRLVSLTVDPQRDTPAVLARYAERYQASADEWFFLTGPQADLHHLNRKVFLLGDVDGSLDHSTRFVLVDRKSRIRGFYRSGETEEINKLVDDIQTLLKERSPL
jgi:protein SCO1